MFREPYYNASYIDSGRNKIRNLISSAKRPRLVEHAVCVATMGQDRIVIMPENGNDRHDNNIIYDNNNNNNNLIEVVRLYIIHHACL